MSDDALDLVAAVRRDLDALPEPLRSGGLAASALDLARRLAPAGGDEGDKDGVRPAAASMLHQQLRQVLLDLRKLAPPAAEEDGVDDLRARRAARRLA